jgi:AI-2 transport protein TqsA
MDRKTRLFFLAIGIIAVLVFFRALLAPLAIAGFLALLLHPVDAWFRRRLPDALSTLGSLMALATLGFFVGVLGFLAFLSAREVGPTLSEHGAEIIDEGRRVGAYLKEEGLPVPTAKSLDMDRVVDAISSGLGSSLSILSSLALSLFFLLFLLQGTHSWQAKAEDFAIGESDLAEVLGRVGARLRTYLRATTAANLISGLLSAGLLTLLDIEHAPIWGLLVFVLAYLPTIGAIVAAIPPITIAYFDHSPQWALVVFVATGLLEQVTGAYILPRIQGRALAISPLVLLAALVFWTIVWGGAGAILAVPMTLVAMGFAEQTEGMSPILDLMRTRSPEESGS